MKKPHRIDFERLLGFELVTRDLLRAFDFQDDTISSRLGAKVGDAESGAPSKLLEASKLLGFETLSGEFTRRVDFQDEAVADRLGAKVGGVESTAPLTNK